MLTESKYFLFNCISEEFYEVNEPEFFEVIGSDRNKVPVEYDKENMNKRNFYLGGELVGYSIRTPKP